MRRHLLREIRGKSALQPGESECVITDTDYALVERAKITTVRFLHKNLFGSEVTYYPLRVGDVNYPHKECVFDAVNGTQQLAFMAAILLRPTVSKFHFQLRGEL